MGYLSFQLDPSFVASYRDRPVPWGFGALSEVTFLTKYSRVKPDGTKERWYEVCERVINGMYSIQKDWCRDNRISWSDEHGERSAEEAFDRLFHFKWTPPGRGLWMMGTEFVHANRNSAALQNCAMVSTQDLFRSMEFLMEASMLGVGVGFNTDGAGKYAVRGESQGPALLITVEDSREGWVSSTDLLLRTLLVKRTFEEWSGKETTGFAPGTRITFDYSKIRPRGEPIKGFGGTAAGPEPLIALHAKLRELFNDPERLCSVVTEADVADIGNLIGKCVVAGNVRRSAEILLGYQTEEFLNLKNRAAFPERNDYETGWGHLSNNSVYANVGKTDYQRIVDHLLETGEPGIFWKEMAQAYGRLIDAPNHRDARVVGTNPCGEQSLESFECCTLVETYPTNAEDLSDYLRTLKFAYLYAKTVTLLPTHWEETNAIMQRNRRIGTSMTGIAQFVDNHTMTELRTWMNRGYQEIQTWDVVYSEWLCVRESIKTTSVKPSGTVSLLAGVTPGVHWPVYGSYIRRMRLPKEHAAVAACRAAGYHVEPEVKDPNNTVVVEFPVKGLEGVRTEEQVSVWEKAAVAVLAQRYWADNQVSCTLTFRKDEVQDLANVLHTHEGQLKSVSFLAIHEQGDTSVYTQMPYEAINDSEYERLMEGITPLEVETLYTNGAEAEGERFCNNDTCTI